MDIVSSLDRATQAPAAIASAVPVEKAAEKREVIQAVKALNNTQMFGQDNELTFQKDPDSQRMVVRVVNKKTKEVVSQIPPEYVLRLACNGKSTGA